MIMCIQNLVKFCPFILKIWSKTKFLNQSRVVTLLQICEKTMIYNTKVDIVNDDVYTKFGLILSFGSQDIE